MVDVAGVHGCSLIVPAGETHFRLTGGGDLGRTAGQHVSGAVPGRRSRLERRSCRAAGRCRLSAACAVPGIKIKRHALLLGLALLVGLSTKAFFIPVLFAVIVSFLWLK